MKKLLIGIIIFIVTIASAYQGDLYTNDIEMLADYGRVGKKDGGGQFFARFHDKQSGVEFICAENSRWNNESSVSCFPTGRNWK